MRISYWSSDVCSSDLASAPPRSRRGIITAGGVLATRRLVGAASELQEDVLQIRLLGRHVDHREAGAADGVEDLRHRAFAGVVAELHAARPGLLGMEGHQAVRHIGQIAIEHQGQRSEEHTSELQSLMRISYAVFCLKKKN